MPTLSVPTELQRLNQWICWKTVPAHPKPRKLPIVAATGQLAAVDKPATWCDFATAVANAPKYSGVGFVFTADCEMTGIDLDDCIDSAGVIHPEAAALIVSFDSYAEISPSGRGVKIWIRGRKPIPNCRSEPALGCSHIEIYDTGRYFAFTGNQYGPASGVNDRSERLATLMAGLFPSSIPIKPPATPPAARTAVLVPAQQRAWKYLQAIPDAVSGQRGSDRTFEAACALYRFDLSDDEAWELLCRYNDEKCQPPWTEKELRHKLTDAAAKVTGDERGRLLRETRPTMTRPVAAITVGDVPQQSPVDAARSGRPWECRDWDQARRFAFYHGNDFKFDVRGGKWRHYNGRYWQQDENESMLYQTLAATALTLFDEARVCEDAQLSSKMAAFALKCRDRSKLDAVKAMAERQPGICPPSESWDADSWKLNCRNGVIDLHFPPQSTIDYLPPIISQSRDMYITKCCDCDYDPSAVSPLWNKSLHQWLSDPEIILYLCAASGYSITGDNSEEKLFFVHGPTNSGKTTFCESIKSALGNYATTADFESFLKSKNSDGSRPRTDIARLAGMRFVTSSEMNEGKELAEGLVKNLSGGEKVTARHLYQENFEFIPTFKLWLIANHSPHVNSDDHAMWRRIVKIPFDKTIAIQDRDPEVKRTLLDKSVSSAAILAWLVRGCILWQQLGLIAPQAINDATANLRGDMDASKGFFEDRLSFDKRGNVAAMDLKKAYKTWCDDEDIRFKLGPRKIAQRLRDMGAISVKDGHGYCWWSGVSLK